MATGKPGQRGVQPKKKKKKKKKKRGGDFEMENSNTGQWWGFKKNRCICLCGTFGRAGKGGAKVVGRWGKVFAGRGFFFFGLGWENLAGKGVVGFFLGGLDQRLLDYPKGDHYLINPVTNDLSFYNFKRHETHF